MTKQYPIETPARRVGKLKQIERAGDYFLTDDQKALWFLLPIARDEDAPPEARSLHRITSPPWTFEVFEDQSVEVRASIAAKARDGQSNVWHGYLDRGNVWREAGP